MANDFELPLRVHTASLTIELISDRLELTPTFIQRRGTGPRPRTYDVWEHAPDYRSAPDDLVGRLEELSDMLRPRSDAIRDLSGQAEVFVWGACYAPSGAASVHLGVPVMKTLADLHVDFFMSVYPTA